MKIFDTHAHYDDEAFADDSEELVKFMFDGQVGAVMNVGADIASSRTSVAFAEGHDHVYAAVGVHPDDIDCLEKEGLDQIKELVRSPKVMAIGEIGLDYFEHEKGEKPSTVRMLQKKWFREQLLLAGECALPVIIHSRDAAQDTWDMLAQCGFPRGVIHCYSYSSEMAVRFVNEGYYLGFGGALTFKNAKRNIESLASVGLEHIVVETDSPYMAPEPVRGTRNNSSNLVYVVKKIAEITGESEQTVIDTTWRNALDLYGMNI